MICQRRSHPSLSLLQPTFKTKKNENHFALITDRQLQPTNLSLLRLQPEPILRLPHPYPGCGHRRWALNSAAGRRHRGQEKELVLRHKHPRIATPGIYIILMRVRVQELRRAHGMFREVYVSHEDTWWQGRKVRRGKFVNKRTKPI